MGKRGTRYPDAAPTVTEKENANALQGAMHNPVRDARNQIPATVPDPPETDRINVGWFLEALLVIVTGLQDALEDGKITWTEIYSIGMDILGLVFELFRKHGK